MTRMFATTALPLALLLSAGSVLGQSVNVDVNSSSGTGAGLPFTPYAAAAGQGGFWGGILTGAAGAYVINGLNNQPTSLTVTRTGWNGAGNTSLAGGSVDFGRLMWDYSFIPQANNSVDFTVNGLDQGLYRVYVYASLPGDEAWYTDTMGFQTYYINRINVLLNNVSVMSGTTTGELVANQFTKGVSHIVGNVRVGPGAPPLVIRSYTGLTTHERSAINGFQLVKIDATRLYVDSSATGYNNGLTWNSAFTDLQDALGLADASDGQITEIWVANGTYMPTTSAGLGSRNAAFKLVNGVKVYGGFAGGETLLEDRNPAVNPVFLSGSIGAAGLADNSYHVVTAEDCGYATLLDGVTVSSGNADGAGGNTMYGGGLYALDSQLTVNNCRFIGNAGWRGGAVAVQGGVPRFEGCYFFNNTAEQVGGGIHMLTGASVKVVTCDFRLNHAETNHGGAIANYDGANAHIFNSRFVSNEAGWGGGGVYAASGSTMIGNCVFTGNTGEADRGGAILATGANNFLFLNNSALFGNHAFQCGGVSATAGGIAYARNTIAWGNTDEDILTNLEAAQVRKDTNAATTMSVVNCDVQGWTGLLGGSGNFAADPQFTDPDGADNVLGTLDDNLRPAITSPCIDRGNNTSILADSADIDHDNNVIEPTPLDLDRNPRRADVASVPDLGVGSTPVVDIGPYEVENPLCYADCTGDGALTVADFGCFQTKFVVGDAYADCNADGQLTVADFGCFQTKFVVGCP